jgi:hypothetical protein
MTQVFEQEMQLGPAAALETLQKQLVSRAWAARRGTLDLQRICSMPTPCVTHSSTAAEGSMQEPECCDVAWWCHAGLGS